jgi:hypothetical protein
LLREIHYVLGSVNADLTQRIAVGAALAALWALAAVGGGDGREAAPQCVVYEQALQPFAHDASFASCDGS